jgi:hypothetical protein
MPTPPQIVPTEDPDNNNDGGGGDNGGDNELIEIEFGAAEVEVGGIKLESNVRNREATLSRRAHNFGPLEENLDSSSSKSEEEKKEVEQQIKLHRGDLEEPVALIEEVVAEKVVEKLVEEAVEEEEEEEAAAAAAAARAGATDAFDGIEYAAEIQVGGIKVESEPQLRRRTLIKKSNGDLTESQLEEDEVKREEEQKKEEEEPAAIAEDFDNDDDDDKGKEEEEEEVVARKSVEKDLDLGQAFEGSSVNLGGV